MSPISNILHGQYGEQTVITFLKKQGFTIRACNFKKRCGEVDIIAAKNELLVFVEVKARQTHPNAVAELIPHSKQRKIITTARSYIAQEGIMNKIIRFDVALVCGGNVEYIADAFTDFSQELL